MGVSPMCITGASAREGRARTALRLGPRTQSITSGTASWARCPWHVAWHRIQRRHVRHKSLPERATCHRQVVVLDHASAEGRRLRVPQLGFLPAPGNGRLSAELVRGTRGGVDPSHSGFGVRRHSAEVQRTRGEHPENLGMSQTRRTFRNWGALSSMWDEGGTAAITPAMSGSSRAA